MNKIVRTLILNAIKTYGKNPDWIMAAIKEKLTRKEKSFVYGFLKWTFINNYTLNFENISKFSEDYKEIKPYSKKPNLKKEIQED